MENYQPALRGILVGLTLITHVGYAQRGYDKPFIQSEINRYKALSARGAGGAVPSQPVDVKYYRLDVAITASPAYLRGSVLMNAVSRQPGLSTVDIDLMSSMHVDSIKAGNTQCAFVQNPSDVSITLDRPYAQGELISVVIYYQGIPGSSGFGSFEFSAHGFEPWIWSLSEPYGAKDWWPCIDHPSDKADSMDMYARCDTAFKVGSNGRLLSVINNGDGTHTWHWHEGHPISTYLVSVAITNYASFSNWFTYGPADSMEVLNYVLPEHLTSALSQLPRVVDELRIYSDLFGLYPFFDEKYGHSEFGWGGGMEHQTMTSLGGFSDYLTAHELSHQWFGDMITCRTWPNIWLNEGFATFCEHLYERAEYGEASYWSGITSNMADAKSSTASVYVADSGSVGSLFNWSRVYAKGSVVLHMLRHVLGDSDFFHSMYNYAHDPRFRFGTATTEDFQSVCEATSGKSLGYFFSEWIYGERYPQYVSRWIVDSTGDGGFRVTIGISQSTLTANPAYFTMPVDFKISAPGHDTVVTLFNNAGSQIFTLTLSFKPTSVRLDPAGWILKSVDTTTAFSAFPSPLNLGSVYLFTSKTDSILIQNGGPGDLIISSVVSDNGMVTVSPDTATIAPSSGRRFTVTFRADSAVPLGSHIYFYHNAAGSPGVVSVTGAGAHRLYSAAGGWNLISLPVDVSDPRASSVFPGAQFPLFHYDTTGAYGGDSPSDSLKIDRGYWVKFKTAQQVAIDGPPRHLDTVAIRAGWNLIGTISDVVAIRNIPIEPPGSATSRYFAYRHTYVIADSLIPGRGYWLKSRGPATLILSGGGSGESLPKFTLDDEPPPPPPGETLAGEPQGCPSEYALEQNYPNPCNPSTVIRYQLPVEAHVTLKIFNILGEEVASLVDERQEGGYKSVLFDGDKFPSGVYLYKIRAGSYSATKKLLLVR